MVSVIVRHAIGGALDTSHRLRGSPVRLTDVIHARMTRALFDLGPTFVKGAQLLSTRRDLLSPDLCDALGRLHDQVAPMSSRDVEQALAVAYPHDQRWPFAWFDRIATASGSIACVYRAELLNGRSVAVKLRRPGIRQRMQADLALLRGGAGVLQHVPSLRKVPARRMVEQVGGAVLQQLDLDREAEALTKLRENLAGVQSFQVPEAIPDASGYGALVMEFVEGLERFGPRRFTNDKRKEIVRQLLRGVYRMLFVDGLVHCDMHPGNLYINPSGLVLLDAGFVVQLAPEVRRLFAKFFLNMSLGRGNECADIVLRSAEHVPPGCDIDGFTRGIVQLVAATTGKRAGQFRLAPFAARLFDLQRRSGVAAAPEFVFPLMSLLVVEGMINDFDVDVDFQAEAMPTLLNALSRH